ncbi:glycosyltransferase [Salinimicrobium oceani]|uniref:Glycosyltransferase n=1 Tax=Salinimicrobium oceani TaxID=2722702 RepID=A0ABX1CU89_9FLAO|nr:glycosyltransferase [Salinimicrobium oceani]NJW51861.1 glycosyltransferase [Salinimicrobium oceani]
MLTILIAFVIIGLVNLGYYLGFFKFAFAPASENVRPKMLPVSVIICAKNEADNLRNFLPLILSQDHPDFEVVVINDASADETLEVIEEFEALDPRVKIVDVQNNEAFWANKKYALTLGIKKAKKPYLLFTDADCRPETDQWLKEMSAHFEDQKSIVLGYGGYLINTRSILNKLIRFETLFTAIQYFSYASWGKPYMGVGRNLAYTSEEFFAQNGFASHLHVKAGDDDLFVNQAANKFNTALCLSPNGITRSVPKEDLKSWFRQKRRHVSIATHYKREHKLMLGLFYSSQLLFWLLFMVLVFTTFWQVALAGLALRWIVQGTVFYHSGKKFNETDLFWIFPFLELFLIWAQLGIFIANLFSKPTHWK